MISRPTVWNPGFRSLASAACAALAIATAGCRTVAPRETFRWEEEIRAFEAEDRAHPPPSGAVLFVGSSSIRLWTTLATDFPDRVVLRRGFGGSQMNDLLACTDRIVLPYRPVVVIVYEGDNDLASGKTPEEVAEGFRKFCGILWRRLPQTRIGFIAIKPSPKRRHLMERAAEANRLIARFCAKDARAGFIDIFSPMLDERGEPRRELFVDDELHLNARGYALWTGVIREHLGTRQ